MEDITVCGYGCGMGLYFCSPYFCNKLTPSVMANVISDCVELVCAKKNSGNPGQCLPYVFIIAYSKLLGFIH